MWSKADAAMQSLLMPPALGHWLVWRFDPIAPPTLKWESLGVSNGL
jgi:hypothetical protein